MIDARECLIAWTPNSDSIRADLLPRRNEARWADNYKVKTGACFLRVRSMTDEQLNSYVMSEFIAAIVRDKICAKEAYLEFWKIKQFRDALPEDMPDAY